MAEQICWGMVDSLLQIVGALDYPPESMLMLERVPSTFLSDTERQEGICLRKYKANENLEIWEHGRIFCNDFELRWEKQEKGFVTVYIGEPKGLQLSDTELLSDFEIHDQSYYLWGEKMTEDTLQLINQLGATNSFLELQIPRLLHYPVSNRNEKFRVKLSARHYLNSETGKLEFYRFRYLEEV